MPSDLMLDSGGDLAIVAGDAVIVTGAAAVKQAILVRLRLVLGEWFLDTTLGVDWFGVVFGKGRNLAKIESLIKSTIQNTDGVARVVTYSQTLHTANRNLAVSFVVETTDGTTVSVNEVLAP